MALKKSLTNKFESSKALARSFRDSIWTAAVQRVFYWFVCVGTIAFVVVGIGITVTPVALGWFLIYESQDVEPVPHVASFEYLSQGENWEKYRTDYYCLPQGASIEDIRYSWFIELERPLSREKFVTPEYMEATGFLMDPSHHAKLPVGIFSRLDPVLNEEVIDITCAACHTGQINVEVDGKYVGLRVDGGQAMHAFTSLQKGHFGKALLTSMIATYSNPFKFDRFARNVICGETPGRCADYTRDAKTHLRRSLAESLGRVVNKGTPEIVHKLYPTHEGFGRVDALARIANRVLAERIDPDANYEVGNAPVNYPQLWDIWKLDRVQFTGSVRQPLARNVGQALGTGANYRFVGEFGAQLKVEELARTSVEFENIYKIEEMLRELEAPRWPADILVGLDEWQIDTNKALAGRELFKDNCVKCHGPNESSELQWRTEAPMKSSTKDHWRVAVIPVEAVGTDPNSAVNFATKHYDMRRMGLDKELVKNLIRPIRVEEMARTIRAKHDPDFLVHTTEHDCPVFGTEQCPPEPDLQKAIESLPTTAAREEASDWMKQINQDLEAIDLSKVSLGEALNYLGLLVRNGHWSDQNRAGDAAHIRVREGFATLDVPKVDAAYKARPLSGVWSTAPYLHNGSVPTVYQLLSPDEEGDGPEDSRCDNFYVGLRGYDPERLGLPVSPDGCDVRPFDHTAEPFDTKLDGNANTGHWFRESYTGRAEDGVVGRELNRAERFAIIEFLKCLRDDREDLMDPACLDTT